MLTGDELLQQILASGRVPTLPDSAMQLVRLGNDPDLYPAQLHSVLANDPALAARIMQVANSAMFVRQSKTGNLGEALALLGVRLALDMAMGIAIVDALRKDEAEYFDFDLYWRKSMLGAIAANEMYATLDVPARGDLFLAALLQDVGCLALLATVGKKYAELVSATRNHLDLVEFEQRAFGFDHAKVGAALARQWQLPESTINAIQHSHAMLGNAQAEVPDDLAYGVSVAGVIAELWIADCKDTQQANRVIAAYLERIGEERYRSTVDNIIAAIPGANEIFNMELLSEEQMSQLA